VLAGYHLLDSLGGGLRLQGLFEALKDLHLLGGGVLHVVGQLLWHLVVRVGAE